MTEAGKPAQNAAENSDPFQRPWGWVRTLSVLFGLLVWTIATLGLCTLVVGTVSARETALALSVLLVFVFGGMVGAIGYFTSRAFARHFLTYLVGGFIVIIIGANGFADTVLSIRGFTAEVTVTNVRTETGKNTTDFFYELSKPDGSSVPGGEYHVRLGRNAVSPYIAGQTIKVIYDPGGLIAPEAPGPRHAAGEVLAGVLVLVVLLVLYSAWAIGGELRRRAARLTGPSSPEPDPAASR